MAAPSTVPIHPKSGQPMWEIDKKVPGLAKFEGREKFISPADQAAKDKAAADLVIAQAKAKSAQDALDQAAAAKAAAANAANLAKVTPPTTVTPTKSNEPSVPSAPVAAKSVDAPKGVIQVFPPAEKPAEPIKPVDPTPTPAPDKAATDTK